MSPQNHSVLPAHQRISSTAPHPHLIYKPTTVTTDLNKNPVRLRNGLEQIVRGPTDRQQGVPKLVGRHGIAELDHAPRQHGSREGHREAKLDVIAGVIVAATQVSVVHPTVAESGIRTPSDSLVLRQETRALALKE